MSEVAIPPALVRNVVDNWHADGERWLANLPTVLAGILRDWELRVHDPYPLSFHWVAPVTRADGSAAVLKLGVPESGHLAVEAAALEFYGGHGAVRLLDHDAGRGALLLERADPGTQARDLVPERDEEATAAIIEVANRLRRPAPADCAMPDLATEVESFAAHLRRCPGDDPLPRHLVERAGRLFAELCASAPERVVLHGDLHHDNVLRADREPWLAIDPHGYVGDPGYEIGAMLYNPDPALRDADLLALVPARVEQLADGLRMPLDRVVAWGFAVAILSEVWDAESGGGTRGRALDVALTLLPHLS